MLFASACAEFNLATLFDSLKSAGWRGASDGVVRGSVGGGVSWAWNYGTRGLSIIKIPSTWGRGMQHNVPRCAACSRSARTCYVCVLVHLLLLLLLLLHHLLLSFHSYAAH